MNKIYKVMYSKVKQCAVVVSEIAKSHGHNGESSDVRKHAALTAAVLIALGSLSFTTAFVPMTAEAATKTGGSNFVGVERTDGLLDDKEYDNYGGKGANGADSITLGLRAKAGEGTITIGDRNAGASLGSVYVGQGDIAKPKLDTGGWVTSIGYNSDATGYGSIALGSNAVARNSYALDSKGESLDLNPNFRLNSKPDIQRASVAIGYGANADNGNIAIGSYSDASTDLRTAKTKDGKEINSYLTDTKADSYVSVGKTGALRRISNVADGAADSDAATIAQLKEAVKETDASKKANIDASNIGKNLKSKADGKTAADSKDITTNENAWGAAIGTGSIVNSNTNGSGQLVTGTTVYNYVAPKAVAGKALRYISEDKSTGINLGILDDKVSTNATDITGLKSLSNITDNGKTVIKKAAVGAVKVIAGDRITVTPDSKNLTDADTVTYTISAKNDGKVESENTNLVSGGTVYSALQNQAKSLTYKGGWGINIDSSKKISLKNNLTTIIKNDSIASKNVKFNIDDTAMAIGGAIFNNSSWSTYVSGKTMTINSTGSYSVRIGGINDSTTGEYSTVTGGAANVASGYASSVNGGKNNTASGNYATVIGGGYNWFDSKDFPDIDPSIFGSDASAYRNDASGDLSVIVGGVANRASGKNSLIAGGINNKASGETASVFGGGGNRADGDRTTISGGEGNFAVGDYSNVSGGIANTTEGRFSTISGGYGNIIVDEGPRQPNRTYYGFPASGKYGSAFGGGYNVVGGENGTAVGGGHSVVYGIRSVGLAGGSTGLGAHYALAAGYQSVVTTKGSKLLVSDKRNEFTDDYYYDNHGYAYKILGKEQNSKHIDFIPEYEDVATAVGYQATANEPDTISFGHDVGDVSGYDVKWKERTDKDEWENINTNPDGTINDYAKKPDIIINHYDTAKYNRLVKVADGINNHDVVVMEQLRNADNVGKNAKNNVVVYKKNTNGTLQVDENGEAVIDVDASKAATEKATEQAIKDSGDAWGGALGTGKVEANNSQLVTGDTVYNAIQNQAEWKLTTNGESADKAAAIKPGTTVNFSAEKRKDHSNVTISHNGSNVTIGLDKDIVLGDTSHSSGGSLNVYTDSSDGNNLSNHVSINGSTISVNYPKSNDDKKTPTDTRGVILGVGEEDSKPDGYIAFNNVEGGYTYLHASTDASDDKKGRLEYVGSDGNKKYIANLDDVSTAVNNAKTKYYAVDENAPLMNLETYKNEGNDGAKGMGSLAAGFVTHADGIASTVVGSYSGVIGSGLQGAAAVSVGTVNVNNNTDPNKIFSGVANSIVGQANMTTDSNAAIIYGAGNTVTNSYRFIDPKKVGAIKDNVSDPAKLSKAMQDAVKESGGQVMVMGGGNNVESAYMSQVVGVGNTVKGNQVKDDKKGWVTDTSSETAIRDYDLERSSQYNYVDGFSNEVINGKHDYIIGANNKLDGDSYDDNNAKPIKRSNKSNVVIGDNHALTGKKNNVIIGSADTEGTLTRASDAVIIGHNANATSATGADNAVAIGLSATATGGNAVTIGVNTSAGENSITIGSESHANSGSNIAIGRSAQVYGYEITNAVALGQEANALVADGVAIGSNSIATVAGNSVKGYDPTGQTSTDTTAAWQATKAAVSIGTADGKVTRQINGVAAGTNDTDAVNVAQLKKLEGMKANVDASNIGANLKGADGKTAAADAEKTTNENAWGEALGTGTVTKDSKQLVTGSTVYNEVRPSRDGKYVKMSQTTGENLLNLDSQVQTNTDKLSDVDSRSVKYDTKTVNDKTVVDNTKITLAGEGGTTITNLKDGVNANDAATMGQLNDRISGVTYKAGDGIKYGTDADNNKTISVNKGDGLKFTEDHKLAVNTGKHLSVNTNGQIDVGDNGTVAENDGNLVTGDTVYKALNGGMTKMIIGTPGKDGKDGKDGTPGTIGLVGPAGTNGKDGAVDITIQKGEDGKDGTKGANGVDGKDGINRIVYEDKNGKHQVATMEDGLKFAGDDGQNDATKAIAKKLNNTVDIIGGAYSTKLTANNIGVNNVDGKLKIQLAQELTGITSISGSTGSNGAKITLDTKDQNISVNGGKITNVASGLSTNDGSYNAKDANNAANISDVNSMISKAVTDAKGETQQDLDKKANVDASNIGTNLKGADGKTAATEAEQKANLDKWGKAIGTGEVKDGSKQLVTGDTVYNAVKDKADKSYVDTQLNTKANTDGSNIDADKFSKKVAIGNINDSDERAVSGKTVHEAIQTINGNIDGKANKNLDNIDDAGKNVIKDQARAAVTIDNKGLNTNVVATQDDKNHTTTYTINVEGNGKVAAKDTGLISGDTLYKEVHVDKDGSYIKAAKSVGQNLSALDSGLKTTSDLIHTNTKGDTIQIGGSSSASKIDVNGKDGKGRVITGVVSDANDPNSAANVGYVNGLTAANTQQIYRDMNNAYGRLNNNINKAAAGSNALAALHPLDYDPDDKADFAVGYGHYRNANAAAVGAFYHPNENTMVNVGVSLGNGDPGFNAGVSFKVGRGGAGREAMSKTEMAKVINSQSKEIDALKKDNADKDKRIDALEQKMAEILAKLDKNGK